MHTLFRGVVLKKKRLHFASRFFISSIFVICLFMQSSYGQDSKFAALYVINFAKYLGWPTVPDHFTITVLGDDPIYDQLKSMSSEAKIGEQNITVNKSMSIDKIDKCEILFISPDKSNLLTTAVAKFGQASTLIVTSKEGLAMEGSSINLVTIGGKLTFEINVNALKKSGLSAKPALFKLGKTI